MKAFLRLFHVSLITLILAGAGVTEAISEALAEHVPRITVIGELVSVEARAGTLAVKPGRKELSLTAATRAAKEALEKFKSGERVKVFYTEADGNLLALAVKGAKGGAKSKRMVKKTGPAAKQ